ncbi:MAG TPA: prolyl-tRNA synthetase associated domain-containing protein [Methyloceanibacter sp.]
MPATRQQLFDRLEELGIASITVEHEPMFTVEQSTVLRQALPGAHTKNLFLDDRCGRVVLVAAKDDTSVNLKELSNRLGAGRFSFGKAELLAEVLGVTPGSVTPFALINDRDRRVVVVVDAELLRFDEVNFHPLENNATTRVTARDLMRFIEACGQEVHILSLA